MEKCAFDLNEERQRRDVCEYPRLICDFLALKYPQSFVATV